MTKTLVRSIRKTCSLLALLVVASLGPGAKADDAVTKGTALAPKVPGKTRIAHIFLGDVTAIAARKGWLQEEFAKYNAKADLVNVASYGTAGTRAALFDRGDLHFGTGMMQGALLMPAQGLDTVVIWESTSIPPRRSVTAVRVDSDIHSVADLKGRTLGSSIIGCPYYAAIESLRAHGAEVDNEFQKGDIRYVNITGISATSAFLSGRYDAGAWHPATSTTASLYVQNQVREIATAVPNGAYTEAGGRTTITTMRRWAEENPDLVKAFLVAWDRTTRWLYADHGAHLDEAATIAARELRLPKAVELFNLKDESEIAFNWGETDYNAAVAALKKFYKYQVEYKDPFFVKNPLTDKQIEAITDRRFFAGGEYFVDTSEKRKHRATAEPPAGATAKTQLALTKGLR
jgi:sulfonate transport system substrate-binding protein